MFSKFAYSIFEQSIKDYHVHDNVDQPVNNPYPKEQIEHLLYFKNWIDTVQWHFEDIIRDPNIDPVVALVLKRRIDASNQERTDMVEYQAAPSFENKNLIMIDPMLATGQSMVAVLQKLHLEQKPKEIHIAVVIAAPEGIEYLQKNLPANFHLWIAAIDEKLNEKNYIVPGLGDAGDLAYGSKL